MVKTQYTTHGIEIGVPVPRIRLEIIASARSFQAFRKMMASCCGRLLTMAAALARWRAKSSGVELS